jgi:uncharacterized protein
MRCWKYVLVICLLSGSLVAQKSSSASASKEEILHMFEVMHTRDQIQQVMTQAMHQMQTVNRVELKKRRPELTDEDLDRMEKESAEIMKGFPVTDMMNDMVPVYQKHLNHADVKALTSFYSTATGQKLLREMPALTAEAMQAAYPRIQQHLEQAFQRIDRQLENDKSTLPPTPPEKN